MSSRKWSNDVMAESKMKFFDNLDWEVKKLNIKDFDKNLSMELNARIGDRTNPEALESYYRSMSLGDVFPRIVVFESAPAGIKSKGYVIAGGIHRFLTAEKLKDKEIEAYVISGDDIRVWDLLPLSLNRDHGLPATQKEAMIKAKLAVNKHGMTAKEASQLFNVSSNTLNRELLAQNMEQRLMVLGVNGVENLPVQVKQRLSCLSNNDVILKATADMLVKNSVANDPAIEIIEKVQKQRSESSALEFLKKEKKFGARLGTRGLPKKMSKARRALTARQKFLMALSNMESILSERDTLELNGIYQKDEQEEVSGRCSNVSRKLSNVSKSHKGKSNGLVGNLISRLPLASNSRNGNSGAKRTSTRSSV